MYYDKKRIFLRKNAFLRQKMHFVRQKTLTLYVGGLANLKKNGVKNICVKNWRKKFLA